MKDALDSLIGLVLVLALTSFLWGPLALIAMAIIASAITGQPLE